MTVVTAGVLAVELAPGNVLVGAVAAGLCSCIGMLVGHVVYERRSPEHRRQASQQPLRLIARTDRRFLFMERGPSKEWLVRADEPLSTIAAVSKDEVKTLWLTKAWMVRVGLSDGRSVHFPAQPTRVVQRVLDGLTSATV